jgi:hypothetical protein
LFRCPLIAPLSPKEEEYSAVLFIYIPGVSGQEAEKLSTDVTCQRSWSISLAGLEFGVGLALQPIHP